jgi:tetratricopeptide (TPR) repeat protein
MDRLHFYWVNVSASLSSLRRATTLNPNDSVLEIRLAHAAEAAGDRDTSLAALRQAATVNPDQKSLQEAYARGLIAAGRDADAYDLYRKLLARSPHDVDSLVNYGLLAQRLGHTEEAADSWQRAVDIDPLQTNAQLYLAQALEKQGEVQAAARHYRAYLQVVGLHPNEHLGEGPAAISALLKVADADADAQRPQQALIGYQAAARFAQELDNVSLQSLAIVRTAEMQERAGEFAAAAQSFQDAVTLDETRGEPRAAASDWFNFGQFLRRQNQSERLVFACFYRAEDLMSTTPGEQLSAIVKARQESAARLGQAANALPALLSKLLSEALSLPPAAFAANHR